MSNNRIAALGAALLLTLAAPAVTAPLPPGGSIDLDGVSADASPARGAAPVYERTAGFVIRDDGGAVLVEGRLNEDVLRRADGTLVFTYRLVGLSADNDNALLVQFQLDGFADSALDADFVIAPPPQYGPNAASRSGAPGAMVRFEFFPDFLFPSDGDESALLTLASDARGLATNGSASVAAQVFDDDFGPVFRAVIDGVAVPGGGNTIFSNGFEAD